MKLTITEKKPNLLLDRVEIKGELDFEGTTPSRKDLLAALVKEIKGEVVVKRISNSFSLQKAVVEAYAYNSAESKKRFEKLTSSEKKKLAEANKAPAAEAAN
jgi:small subunit ribosomal protein S24e